MTAADATLQSDPAPGGGHDGHEEHHLGYVEYLGVWAILIVLTLVTVGVTWLHLKHFVIPVAMGIATVKSSLVLLYFMHLRYERPLFAYMFLAVLATWAVFVTLTFTDYGFR